MQQAEEQNPKSIERIICEDHVPQYICSEQKIDKRGRRAASYA
jgi:hypothetical protein